jgi:hypothetical protein
LLPRRLALETLHTLQILFLLDYESSKILNSLISREGFDPGCSQFESTDYQMSSENEKIFHYWMAHLVDLDREVENPTPRGIRRWLEMRSGARYVMMVTIIAIILGVLGLAVQSFQAWVSYQQWKHPVPIPQ